MKRFQYKAAQRRIPWLSIFICICLTAVILFLNGISMLSESSLRRQKTALENALTRSITYCYTVDGVYPESLDYLKDNYGLLYNEDLFFVDYRLAGSNIFPDVTIIERKAE